MSDREASAIERANAARTAIARIIDAVATGSTDLEGAFAQGDADPLTGRVFAVKVFEAVPGIGKVRARRTMQAIGLPGDIALAAVPPAERAEIAAAFRDE